MKCDKKLKAMNFKELANQLRSAALLIEDLEEVKEENLPENWADLSREAKRDASAATVTCDADIENSLDALSQLYDLRQEYWRIAGDWEPDWYDDEQIKFVIDLFDGDYITSLAFISRYFLAFPTEDQAHHFLIHHKKLIERAQEFL